MAILFLLGFMGALGAVLLWAGRTEKPQMGVDHDLSKWDGGPPEHHGSDDSDDS